MSEQTKHDGMTHYPDSTCEEHLDVATSEPVCIMCMSNEIDEQQARIADLELALFAENQKRQEVEQQRDMQLAAPNEWRPASDTPDVGLGDALHCWVAAKSKRDGKVRVWDAHYCNFPKAGSEEDEEPDWVLHDENGDPTAIVGWAEKAAHPDFNDFYILIGSEPEVIAWKPVQRPAAPAALLSAAPKPAGETCENGQPDCGPVAHHDIEGVPLCARCWQLEPDACTPTSPS